MDEEKTCQCQPHWFWKWTYRLLFIFLVFLILNLLFAVWDVKNELREINQREIKKELTKKTPEERAQEWIKIFNQIGEAFDEDRRRMENEEKIKQWKRKYFQLKPGETYKGLTKENIKKMLQILGYWDE